MTNCTHKYHTLTEDTAYCPACGKQFTARDLVEVVRELQKENRRRKYQPLVMDGKVVRFRTNKIVKYLLDNGPFDMNHLAIQGFSKRDHRQFAQLIGYSVSGYGDLNYVGNKRAGKSDAVAEEFMAQQDNTQ